MTVNPTEESPPTSAKLVDVSSLSLSTLRSLQDSALALALRRVLDQVDRSQGAVAGWQSAI